MSRIPQPSSSRPAIKTPALFPPSTPRSRAPSPSKPTRTAPGSPVSVRVRTKSVPKSPTKSGLRRPPPEDEPPIPKTNISIKEAIALKRAEAKKAAMSKPNSGGDVGGFGSFENMEDALPTVNKVEDQNELDLGRWSVKETIERARSTGSINLSSRALQCIPSALFDIHLGITPDTLESVPKEPPITTSTDPLDAPVGSGRRGGAPTWFEAQDLQVLKAWSNEIIEIQHEISLFGSLKIVDLHQNKIAKLPHTFGDLTHLTTLDLSHNALSSLPTNMFALPNLAILNLSHNSLVELPFNAPFSGSSSLNFKSNYQSNSDFFAPAVVRAISPLPRLTNLDASYNKLTVNRIDHAPENLPPLLSKIDLSANPLSSGNTGCSSLIRALAQLKKLKHVRFATADIGDDAFPSDVSADGTAFPSLRVLDMGETRITEEGIKGSLSGLKQDLTYDLTADEPPEGTLRVIVGKKIIREAWELEVELRVRGRGRGSRDIENTESAHKTKQDSKEEVVKEAWEIEAEQGLLTEGGRRRARAALTASINPKEPKSIPSLGNGSPSTTASKSSQISPVQALTNAQYYHATTQTLTLPASTAPTKSHARSFSLAASSGPFAHKQGMSDIALPTPTLPLAAIYSQPFSQTLRVLTLTNRRHDPSFSLPSLKDAPDMGLLPHLEELVLDGCNLGDNVPVTRVQEASSENSTTPRSSEALLPLLTKLFPSLRTLDLSYNSLTSEALKTDVLTSLIMASSTTTAETVGPRQGLRHLRLRGNRITELEGFQGVAELFKGHRDIPDWKLEELDFRDNEISKLPSELGLLPLDVFLVDGNV
ncbi:hypothetical protein SERLADRAFT_369425 [Serpula lacrymans var. lacrymans S7.9]|nr:uncharacterized protein SERLADRAFT_369425 [Serpula lacrymans var. lacrymans S7.9]EGO24190.1 hypothetical protein SERLADRAFT_369425 [Serpula lacrymans var. lacrymans S7.9]